MIDGYIDSCCKGATQHLLTSFEKVQLLCLRENIKDLFSQESVILALRSSIEVQNANLIHSDWENMAKHNF